MRGIGENLLGGALLHHAAGVHDHHVVGHLGDNTQVVGDQHDGGIDLILQAAKQVQDLGLDGHVQSRGGLIGDDQAGIAGQSHSDHDTLAHTAGQLVRKHLVDALAVGDTGHLQQMDGAGLDVLGGLAFTVVQGNDLIQLGADAKHRVQAGHGLLENHGHVVAAELLHLLNRSLGDVISLAVAQIQANLALHDLALGPLKQLHDGQAGNGLAAAGLTHHAHGLADGHIKGDAVYRADGSHVREEVGVQILDLQGVVLVVHLGEEFLLGHVLALVQLFKLIRDFAVLPGNPAGFLRGQIAVFVFLSHMISSFLSASSSGQRHPAVRRQPG